MTVKELNVTAQILKTYKEWSGIEPIEVSELPPSGSYRRYFRIKQINNSIIAVYNEDSKENIAFCTFTQNFLSKGLAVPALLFEKQEDNIYFLEDLGDTTLLLYLQEKNFEKELCPEIKEMYKRVISALPLFQVKGHADLDYSKCYPREAFDKQSMMWDLNYFKYYFLKLARVPFNEQELEDDYQRFSDYLLSAPSDFFMYRDFQSRNVMIVHEKPYFIDYQGGRKGALQYDIASILFESKTALPDWFRQEMLEHYLDELSKIIEVDRQKFIEYYYGFVYIRLMQAMGAYGFRGLYEKKELFLQSIPHALKHLEWLQAHAQLTIQVPTLQKVWNYLISSESVRNLGYTTSSLKVSINSFSYRKEIPRDESQNGGGFVFDCRAQNNPGRYEQYKNVTGRDPQVHAFFQDDKSMKQFLNNCFSLVEQSISNYRERGFTSLMVNFGCTGGQHRSVYSAEMLYYHLKQRYPDINLVIRHREQEKL